jgi:cysteine desulfurase
MDRHYFDYAATALTANPSSRHLEGRAAKEALEEARRRCAAVLGLDPGTLYFTSGGTEANAIVIFSTLLRPQAQSLLTNEGEHASVRENMAILGKIRPDISVQSLGLDRNGRLSPALLAVAIEKQLAKGLKPSLATIMLVNNETGAINDIEALRKVGDSLLKKPLRIHSDCVQALGKIGLSKTLALVDSASFSAHKIGGPRGVGLLYLRQPIEVLARGGGQEGGIRSGTENVAGALGMAEALEACTGKGILEGAQGAASERMARLIGGLREMPRCHLIPEDRADSDRRFSPWILQAAFEEVPGEVMLRCLDSEGFAVGTGSACSANKASKGRQVRPVLEAMGLSQERIMEGIRISQGPGTTMGEIEALLEAIRKILCRI